MQSLSPRNLLPARFRQILFDRWRRLSTRLPRGSVAFGDLRRLTPISRRFGYDRGQPIDRCYIERFLTEQTDSIQGEVLEVGDRGYTSLFGGRRVTTSHILDRFPNPEASFVGDLACPNTLPTASFDCVILTQTLHLVFDVRGAVATLHRCLKPGGVLLATFPGISQLDGGDWHNSWYWSLTTVSAERLFHEFFPSESVEIAAHGNVLAAIAFLHGLAAHELAPEELAARDPNFQVLVTVRAQKLAKAGSAP